MKLMKVCSGCGASKKAQGFYADARASDGLQSACKPCMQGRTKRARSTPAARAAAQRYQRREALKRYGMTEEAYDAMAIAQGGRCATCRTDEPGGNSSRLVVDHDHATGRVRGLLCTSCNVALGHLRDSPAYIGALGDYISPRTFQAGLSEGLLQCA